MPTNTNSNCDKVTQTGTVARMYTNTLGVPPLPLGKKSIPVECSGVCVWRHAKPPQSCWGVYFCKPCRLRLAITIMRKSLGACRAHLPGYRYACWHMPNPPLSPSLVVNALSKPQTSHRPLKQGRTCRVTWWNRCLRRCLVNMHECRLVCWSLPARQTHTHTHLRMSILAD